MNNLSGFNFLCLFYVCGLCVFRMLSSDSRASSLLRGSASRKLATDRDMHMTLWKNYVVMGCCTALPSHSVNMMTTTDCHRCVTPELTAMSVSPAVCLSVLSVCLSGCRPAIPKAVIQGLRGRVLDVVSYYLAIERFKGARGPSSKMPKVALWPLLSLCCINN